MPPLFIAHMLSQFQGCFGGDEFLPDINRRNLPSRVLADASDNYETRTRRPEKREFTCPPSDLSNIARPIESATAIPI